MFVSCRGMGLPIPQQWTASGTGALGAADLDIAYAFSEEVAINPTIEPPELIQDWEIVSWRAQTEPHMHQDSVERNSDPTKD